MQNLEWCWVRIFKKENKAFVRDDSGLVFKLKMDISHCKICLKQFFITT